MTIKRYAFSGIMLLSLMWRIDGAHGNVGKASSCRPMFENRSAGAPFTMKSKPKSLEADLIQRAMRTHYKQGEIDPDETAKALLKFTQLADPFGFSFTRSEVEGLRNMPQVDRRVIHDLLFNEASRAPFEVIVSTVTARLSELARVFGTNPLFRDLVFQRAKEIYRSGEHPPLPRPEGENEMLAAFGEFLALRVVEHMRAGSDRQAAFRLMIRDVRVMLRNHIVEINRYLPLMIAKAYISGFDPHSDLHMPYETDLILRDMRGSFVSLGLMFQPSVEGVIVSMVLPGGGAHRAGLKEGDVITHIRSVDLQKKRAELMNLYQGWTLLAQAENFTAELLDKSSGGWIRLSNHDSHEARELMMGKKGSFLDVRVLRDGQAKEIRVKRSATQTSTRMIQTKIVESRQGPLGYVEFGSFYEGSAVQLREEIVKVKKNRKPKGFVLDLRGNGGGSTDEMARVLGIFVKAGPAMVQFELAGVLREDGLISKEHYASDQTLIPKRNQPVWEGPLVVLTDFGSASASEALAGALQDYDRAIVVGGPQTFGKGTFQRIEPMSLQMHGSDPAPKKNPVQILLRWTSGLFLTPDGQAPQLVGIESDVVIPQPDYGVPLEVDYGQDAISPIARPSLLPWTQEMRYERAQLVGELRRRYEARGKARPTQSLLPQDIYEENTRTALEVLQDLIELNDGKTH